MWDENVIFLEILYMEFKTMHDWTFGNMGEIY